MALNLKRKRAHSLSPSPSTEIDDEQAAFTDDQSPPPTLTGHAAANLSRPPTGEQLRNIKDAADLFRSTSFKLQVCSLLHRPSLLSIPTRSF